MSMGRRPLSRRRGRWAARRTRERSLSSRRTGSGKWPTRAGRTPSDAAEVVAGSRRIPRRLKKPDTPPSGRGGSRLSRRLLPFAGLAALLVGWDLAIRYGRAPLLPGPLPVGRAIVELGQKGFRVKHVVASLVRVTWGYPL